jgi:hypothetical protein
VTQGNAAHPAGLFRGGSNVSILELPRVPKGSVIAVTVEQAGGVGQPTQKPFVTSKATT